jgi:hypothetical protein
MNSPNRINVCLNAADACEYFGTLDVLVTPHTGVTSDQIARLIGMNVGKLFVLHGFDISTNTYVTLSPRLQDSKGIMFSQHYDEPYFQSHYIVAAEPPPRVSVHGDILFDLVRLIK